MTDKAPGGDDYVGKAFLDRSRSQGSIRVVVLNMRTNDREPKRFGDRACALRWPCTQLYNFPDSSIGRNPLHAVTLVGHTLYGITTFCGANRAGTVYVLDLDSLKASLLYSFAANHNGSAGANELVYQNGGFKAQALTTGAPDRLQD